MEVGTPREPNRITDPSRLAELREMNNYTGQPNCCDACGSAKRAPGLCCIVCGKPADDPSTVLAAARQAMQSDLRKEIECSINKFSAENGSNTPDFILAQYLIDCLGAFDKAVTAREKWYGREPKPVPADECPAEPTKPVPSIVNKFEFAVRDHQAGGVAYDAAYRVAKEELIAALGSKPAPVAHGWITNSPTAQGERCCNPPTGRTPLSPGSVAD